MTELRVCFLGYGSMAESLSNAFTRKEILLARNITGTVRTNDRIPILSGRMPFRFITSNVEAVLTSDIIIISVRPQQAKELLKEIGAHVDHEKTVVSIMAGIPLASIRKYLPGDPTLVHVHPTSLAFSRSPLGVSFLVADSNQDEKKVEIIGQLFKAVGEVRTLSEDILSKYIVLSGCAPAYLSLFVYYLSQIGAEIGIPLAESSSLEALMVSGIREVIVNEEASPQEIIQRIATPEGVTMEGLQVLESEATRMIVRRAAEASLRKLDFLSTVL